MISPVVTRLLRSKRAVVQHVEHNGELVDQKLLPTLTPHLREAERVPEAGLLLPFTRQRLHEKAAEQAYADGAIKAEKCDDRGRQRVHDASAAERTRPSNRRPVTIEDAPVDPTPVDPQP